MIEPGDHDAPDGGPVLAVDRLRVSFRTPEGVVRAVDDVSFSVAAGEIVGIVGESGCGKSMTALSLMGLVPDPGQVSGSIRLAGRELVGIARAERQRLRGNAIAMVFQEPMTSLDPVMRIGRQVAEPLVVHHGLSQREARRRAVELLQRVRIPEPERHADAYPHQLSGGMRQRAMIAMALACRPAVLIADEPTTALDVTIQAQILRLMLELRTEFGTAVVLISHDLGVIAQTADRVVVMYAGSMVEAAPVAALFARPQHPYTVALLAAVPRVDRTGTAAQRRLAEIAGTVPPPGPDVPGCRFAPRCRLATGRCHREHPPLEARQPGHVAACWHADRAPQAADG